jgi:hypothetical protein
MHEVHGTFIALHNGRYADSNCAPLLSCCARSLNNLPCQSTSMTLSVSGATHGARDFRSLPRSLGSTSISYLAFVCLRECTVEKGEVLYLPFSTYVHVGAFAAPYDRPHLVGIALHAALR